MRNWFSAILAIFTGCFATMPLSVDGISLYLQRVVLKNVDDYSKLGFCVALDFGVAVLILIKQRQKISVMFKEVYRDWRHDHTEGFVPSEVYEFNCAIGVSAPAMIAFAVIGFSGKSDILASFPGWLLGLMYIAQFFMLNVFSSIKHPTERKPSDFRGGYGFFIAACVIGLANLLSLIPGFSGILIVYCAFVTLKMSRKTALSLSLISFAFTAVFKELIMIVLWIFIRLQTNYFWAYFIAMLLAGIVSNFAYNRFIIHGLGVTKNKTVRKIAVTSGVTGVVMIIVSLITKI